MIAASSIASELNDDCWAQIFSFLPAKDVIRNERVCKRWQMICSMTGKKITITDRERNIYEQILQKNGRSITNLQLVCLRFEATFIFGLLHKYCSCRLLHLDVEVKKLSISDLDLGVYHLLKNLKSLHITNSENKIFEGTYLDIMQFLDKLNKLKDFSIYYKTESFALNYYEKKLNLYGIKFSGDFNWEELFQLFVKFTDYKEGGKLELGIFGAFNFLIGSLAPISNQLTILRFAYIPDDCFVYLKENCLKSLRFKNLKTLAFTDLKYINNDNIIAFATKCPSLEEIYLDDTNYKITYNGYHCLASLNNLKHLEIPAGSITYDTLYFIALNCSKLEHIVCLDLGDFSASQLNSIINLLPNLNSMNLKSCEKLTDEFLISVVESVRQRESNVKLKIDFWDYVNTDEVNLLIRKDLTGCPDLDNDYVTITVTDKETGKHTSYYVISG